MACLACGNDRKRAVHPRSRIQQLASIGGRRRFGFRLARTCPDSRPSIASGRIMSRLPHQRAGRSAALSLYSSLWWLGTPFALLSLLWRARRQRGYLSCIGERFGWVRQRDSDRRLLWVHAVSVGETRAAEPLIRAMAARWPDAEFLLTHMTPTGRDTGASVFADLIKAGHMEQAWLAWDYPGATRRMLERSRPVLGLIMETELWPNLVASARSLGVPLGLVNARLSEKSLRKGRRWAPLIRPALAGLDIVLAQTARDAERLSALGRTDVSVTGNMKFDISPSADAIAEGQRWRAALQTVLGCPRIIVAASTRDGEEALLLKAWGDIQRAFDPALLPLFVLIPRHPQRFNEVAELARSMGFKLARRSELVMAALREEALPALEGCNVLLGDSMGEMFTYYAMADAAIIGGSLAPFGGQNLIEACAAGLPVVIGPHTFNFEQASADAVAAGAAVRVPDAEQATHVAMALVNDPTTLERARTAALNFAEHHRGATQRTINAVASLLGD